VLPQQALPAREKIPYEIGLARYAELAKGQMLGDEQGLLKILFDPDTCKLLGVHIIGDRAAEIVHTGQAVLTMGGDDRVFPRHGLQLPNAGGSLQGRSAGWTEQALTVLPAAQPRIRTRGVFPDTFADPTKVDGYGVENSPAFNRRRSHLWY
jgi:hypothetical protein